MRGRTRLILAAVGVVIFSLLLYFFFVNPQRTELSEVRAQIDQEETRTAELNIELQRLRDLQANEPKLRAELEQIRSFVPVRPELSNFIFQVQKAANDAGLDFIQVTPELPKEPPEGATLAEVRSTLGAVGGYFALQDFVRRLYTLDRALRVDTIGLGVQSLEPFGTRLTMTINARIFYELPEPVFPTTTGGTPAPGVTPTPTVTP
jgi:Tfp pilus assembly protein PilO